jgi:hypothetical protein
MGLDMYLLAKRHLNNNGDIQLRETISNLFPDMFSKVEEVTFDAGYWRKANHIHGWFVKLFKKIVLCSGTYAISREELQDLRNTCKQVLNNKDLAEELLPRVKGYFFGSQEIDDTYFKDISDTISIIDNCLNLPTNWYFYYRAS